MSTLTSWVISSPTAAYFWEPRMADQAVTTQVLFRLPTVPPQSLLSLLRELSGASRFHSSGSSPGPTGLSWDSMEKVTKYCYPPTNKLYYLVAAQGDGEFCTGGGGYADIFFQLPPGLNQLDGNAGVHDRG
ncbi:hypothetical protein F5Y19DRAFT_483004 [Xylariaceae sp. FL1651]|nr:hypothetical protein F5Y19DRAFT_483004 [Xylariaceae sp. FL1651]